MKEFWMNVARAPEGEQAGGEGGEGDGGGGAEFIPQGLDLGDYAKPTAPETIGALHEALQAASQPQFDPAILPEALREKPAHDAIQTLVNENKGFRDAQAKRGDIPKASGDYKFEPSETTAKFLPEPVEGQADPVMEMAKELALANEFTQPQFNSFVNGMYEKMAEAGIMQAPLNPKAELANFGKFAELPDDTAVAKRHDELTAFGQSFAEKYNLGEDGKAELDIMTDTAGGLKVLHTLQTVLRERGIELGGDPANSLTMTDEEFDKLSGSDEIDPTHADFSKEKRKAWEIESNRRADMKSRAG